MVVSRSNFETTSSRPRWSGIELRIGSRGIRGSPGKYICVTSRLAGVLARQVGVFRANWNAPEHGPLRDVKPIVGQPHRSVLRRTQLGRAVVGKQVGRLVVLVGAFLVAHGPLTGIMNWRKLRSSVHGAIALPPA